ncbi:hypothetical protein KJ359_011549 [Pestalotiopsis sp. 9143b]|nr:hypothetical protein KJ359_011549 [Pestalotiopsis sp. 9143b]
MSSVEKNNKPRGGSANPNDPREDEKKTRLAEGEDELDGATSRGLGEEGPGRDACRAGREQHGGGPGSVEYIDRRGVEKADVEGGGEKEGEREEGGEEEERRRGGAGQFVDQSYS